MTMSRRTFVAAAALAAGAAPIVGGATTQAVDEGAFVDINGVQQWITIRGQDRGNPVLLWLHGGPGIGGAFMAPVFADWEQTFTIVQWDQPGGGSTDLKNVGVDVGPMTIARFRRDGLAVADYVLRRLGKRRLVLMGNSWGTLLGIEMVKARPQLFSAYVGASQAVGARGNKLGYELALQAARERGDTAGVAALERVGPPPYRTFEDFLVRQTYSNPPGQPMSPAELAATADVGRLLSAPPAPDAHYIAFHTIPPGYDGMKAFFDTQRALFKETWAWEARSLGLDFKVPVFIFQGEHDFNTPTQTAREYFDEIKAPAKAFEIIPGAGHKPEIFHAQLLALLKKDVLPVLPGG